MYLAALLPNEADRASLRAAAPSSRLRWTSSWSELIRCVRDEAITGVVADARAESRKDGALRVFRFTQRFPNTPLIAWGDVDGRELFRLGKAGARDVVVAGDADDAVLVGEMLSRLGDGGVAELLDDRLRDVLGPEARHVLGHAAEHVPAGLRVPALAAAFGLSVSTLERRCEEWGLPTPGRLLLWLRVLHGLRWLLEPGRSVQSVAHQLGYSSGAAFRRSIRATIGGRPTPLRNPAGFERAVILFLEESRGRTKRDEQ